MIQKTVTHCCKKCQSPNIVRNGHNACGSPLYKCKACNTYGVLKSKHKTQHIDQDVLERTYLERNSYRSTARLFEISHISVINLIKKKRKV